MFFETLDDQHDTLGGRLVRAREAQDLTTSQFARQLGIKTTTLEAWESDRSEPRSNKLLMLAGMLNVSPTWLLTGAGESPPDAIDEIELTHIRSTVERLNAHVQTIANDLQQLERRLDSYGNHRS